LGGTGETAFGDSGSLSSIENPNNFAIIYLKVYPYTLFSYPFGDPAPAKEKELTWNSTVNSSIASDES
jgi:hypothetical protein